MKRSLILVILVLASLLLSSCTGPFGGEKIIKFEDSINPGFAEDPVVTLNTKSSISVTNASYSEYTGSVVHFVDDDGDHIFFNYVTNVQVAKVSSERYSSSFFKSIYALDIDLLFVVTVNNGAYTTRVYNDSGVEVASVKESVYSSDVYTGADLITFGGDVWRVGTDARLTKVCSTSKFSNVSNLEYYTSSYYYVTDSSSVTVFDKQFAPVNYYEFPYETDECYFYILTDGTVFIQAVECLPEHEDDYDYLTDGDKYNIMHYLFTPADGKVKELDLDYYFEVVAGTNTMGYDFHDEIAISTEISNIALAYPIVDQRLYDSESDAKFLSVDNKLKIKGVVAGDLKLFDNDGFYKIANDRYSYYTVTGNEFIVNGKGEYIADMSDIVRSNENYLISDKALYDFSMNMVYNFDADGLEVYKTTNRAIIFKTTEADEDGEYTYYVYNNGNKTRLSEDVLYISYDYSYYYYMVVDDVYYTIYNDIGEVVYKTKNSISFVCGDTDAGVFLFKEVDSDYDVLYFTLK